MKTKFKEDIKNCMKTGRKVEVQVLRSLCAALQYEEMQKGLEDLPETDVIIILKNEIKKRRESLEFEEKAERAEAIDILKKEIACLEEYLPTQLSGEQIEKIIIDLKEKNPAMNMGIAMKELKDKYSGQYDGKLASDLAKKILG
jgi:uncharacterized protein YqeY